VFLLIIFFLVSSHLAKQENSVQLDLPQASSAMDDLAQRETLVVNILPDGQWQLAGADVDEAKIAQAFARRMMAASEPIQLRIRTDRNVTYERIAPLLRIATTAGIGDIVFSVYSDSGRGAGG
jgi:biopolymer transport protein ExbD